MRWSKEEEEFLCENWGYLNIKTIAKKLNRSENAIISRKNKLRLGAFLENGEYVTFYLLMSTIIGGKNPSYQMQRLERDGFPIKHKTVKKKKWKVVYIKDFWKWAEEHQSKFDFKDFEENSLGPEPKWAKEKRINDRSKTKKLTPWTPEEDKRLIELLRKFKYTRKELSDMLNRTEGGIDRRILELKLKERPLIASKNSPWTEEHFEILTEMIKQRKNYNQIAGCIDKSEKAIRGKVYYMYLTENIDIAAKYIGNGKFGDNRPDRNIQNNTLTGAERKQVKENLTKFCNIIYKQMKEKYDANDYWQSEICQNYSRKCLVQQTCCDECTNFIRIKPQYCNRCGATVMSRNKVTICDRCKLQRKKQYQKKYMALKNIKKN